MAELRRKKLACFQKTCNGIVKKVDTTITSGAKVNSFPLSFEDLIQLVDVSITSKYGAEDMRNMLETFKTDLNNNLS
jgi:hypothetical protein